MAQSAADAAAIVATDDVDESPASSGSKPNDPVDPEHNDVLRRTRSRGSVLMRMHTGASTIVPRAKRIGFLSSLAIVPEVEDPREYTQGTKHFIVFLVAAAAMSGPMSSGILLPALSNVERDFGTTATVANLTITTFLIGMGVSPLWLAYVSEHFGRRTVYLLSFSAYTVFSILCAVSQSISQLLAFRLLAALSSGAAQAIGAGVIADIYLAQHRGNAMGWFYLGPIVGPLMSPVLGGLLTSAGSWRNTQWFIVAKAGTLTILLLFCLPETLRDAKVLEIYDKEAGSLRMPTKMEVFLHTLADPLKTIKFFAFPAVACSIAYASLNFGSLYFLNISIEYSFEMAPYNFRTIIIGCLYLGNSIGYIIGSILGGKWCDIVMQRAKEKEGGEYIPERRFGLNAWTGAFFAPAGLFIYGWTIGQFWLIPLIGTFIFGLATMFIYAAVTTYLIDALPGRGSSAMALNNLVRMLLAAGASAAAEPALKRLGNHVLFSILASVCWASTVLVLLILRKGDAWRAKAAARAEMAASQAGPAHNPR
ncbi:major facilitator superfamily domain-containing protein [Protomyces lactucae-debilis]|uniref:Major facilitator superfamily domain-containing protein n=1 Tax=Protomyces lactucae-debilis TaxID=2754530 RepID=A0A1Y2FPW5_PROLT|nr:major facilitator superfamily domain-containing protein [Protomyces lactucae-debilis]ORY85647.1 major facilitator superfamily domain-containing protein [Protomyces lactucae-debilis]